MQESEKERGEGKFWERGRERVKTSEMKLKN